MFSWTFPIVTGSNYYMKWANNLDFNTMSMSVSDYWLPTDLPTYITFTYID